MKRPPLPKMLVRGLFRRCAWCGGRGAFFTGWAKKSDHCSSCGLQWRRGDVGYELGAAAVAAIICMGPLVLILLGVMLATWPDFDVVPMFIVLGAGAIVLPLLLYPSSYTMWQGIDILMRPVQPEDFVSLDEPEPGESDASQDAEVDRPVDGTGGRVADAPSSQGPAPGSATTRSTS